MAASERRPARGTERSADADQRPRSTAKPCKYCCTTIHRKARVCANCNRTVTLFGGLTQTLFAAFPMFTAIVSLAFAYNEHTEKQVAARNLIVEESQREAAVDLLKFQKANSPQLAGLQSMPSLMRSTPEFGSESGDAFRINSIEESQGNPGLAITPQSQLAAIEEELVNELAKTTLNRDKLKSLQSKKLKLQLEIGEPF